MFSIDDHHRKRRGEPAEHEALQAALAALEDVLARCRDEDMRREIVFASLDFLEQRLSTPWPVRAFRRALDCESPEARWQNANAALNGIRRQFGF